MDSYGVLKLCVCLITFMWIIFHTDARISSTEGRILNRKLDLMRTGFDSKLIAALIEIEDLRLTETCKCQEVNITDKEHTVEEAVQKNTNKKEDHDKQTIRDDVARLTTGLMSEKQARKVFGQKTEGLIQQKSKSQHKKINKLKNIVNIMKNTIGQQRDKINHISEDIVEMKTFTALQQDKIVSLTAIVSDLSSSIDSMKKSIPRCPEPASFNNGEVKYDDTSIGDIVRYVCDEGYRIQGANHRTCLSSGKWNGKVPVCIPDCPKPTSFNNGNVQYHGTSTGSIMRYVCDAGYSIQGANERTCLSSGNWNGEIPVCNQACKKPASLKNGFVKYTSTRGGSIAVYECEDNYGLEGKHTRKCLPTKRWEGESPVCVPVYGPPLRAAMYVGARVQRGRDWNVLATGGNSDGNGPGTVKIVNTDFGLYVDWDRTIGSHWYYISGRNDKYQVMFVPGTYDSSKAGQGQQKPYGS